MAALPFSSFTSSRFPLLARSSFSSSSPATRPLATTARRGHAATPSPRFSAASSCNSNGNGNPNINNNNNKKKTNGSSNAGNVARARVLTRALASSEEDDSQQKKQRLPSLGSTPRPKIERKGVALRLIIKNLTGANYLTGTDYLLEMWTSDTVFHIKQMIEDVDGIPVEQQRLFFHDNSAAADADVDADDERPLEDDNSLGYYNIPTGAVLNLALNLRGGRGGWWVYAQSSRFNTL